MKVHAVIPARAGSKRFPGKNALLPVYCAEVAQAAGLDPVIWADNPALVAWARTRGLRAPERPHSADRESMRDCVAAFCRTLDLPPEDVVVVLYSTFAAREPGDLVDLLRAVDASLEDVGSWLGLRPLQTPAHLVYRMGPEPRPALVDEDECYRVQDAARAEFRELTHFHCAVRVAAVTQPGALTAQLRAVAGGWRTEFLDADPARSAIDVDEPHDLLLGWAAHRARG